MKLRLITPAVVLYGGLLMAMALSNAAHAAGPWYKARTYSSLGFNSAEGETYGLEVITLPSSHGVQVLWRLGSGKMERALLLDAVQEGKNYVVEVPPVVDGAGRWVLSTSEQEVVAKGPRGQVFHLKRVTR